MNKNHRTRSAMLKVVCLWLKFLDWKLDYMLQCKKKAIRTTDEGKRWDESKHPRKSNGQFGHGDANEGESSGQKEAVAGALDPESERADKHAARYYGLVRSMTTDVPKIAKNTGIPEDDVRYVKDYIFMDKHDLGGENLERFDPSFYMAESWQRLIQTAVKPRPLGLGI